MGQNGRSAVEVIDQSVTSGIHYTQLAGSLPGEAFFDEWNTYCREVGRLLAEGQAGRFVLIKGNQILDVFASWDAARTAGLQRYLREPFFVHEIRMEEPHLRIRGVNLPCRS